MKKIISACLLITVLSFSSFSQGYLGASYGMAIPIGNFDDASFYDGGSGFANSGYMFDFYLAREIKPTFGIAGMVKYQFHDLNERAIENWINEKDQSGDWVLDDDTYYSTTWDIRATMLGMFYNINNSNSGVSLDFRALAGLSDIYMPAVSFIYPGGGYYTQYGGNTSSISYLIGAGFTKTILHVQETSHLALIGSVDLFSCQPRFSDIRVASSSGHDNIRTLIKDVRTVNISIGLAFTSRGFD